jgi:hypothetical protein
MQMKCDPLGLQQCYDSSEPAVKEVSGQTPRQGISLAGLTRDVVIDYRREERIWILVGLSGAAALAISFCL